MEISAQQVKELREKTGAGMMDCKKALVESKGDMEEATVILRKKGVATAQKKSGRAAAEGMIGHYIHMGGKIGVLVEVNCETDFAAKSEGFQNIVRDLAMHIAAANPRYVRRDDVPAEELAKEKEIYRDQARASGKPEQVLDKIAEGKLGKFYEDFCLYDQIFVKDESRSMTVEQLINNLIGKIGENIRVRRFVRYQTGEGLEKRTTDLKGEVEGMLGQQ
jgi:elongation factor Ts